MDAKPWIVVAISRRKFGTRTYLDAKGKWREDAKKAHRFATANEAEKARDVACRGFIYRDEAV